MRAEIEKAVVSEPKLTVIEYANGREVHHHLSFPRSLQGLLDLIFKEVVGDEVPVYSYGVTWALRNMRSNQVIEKVGAQDGRRLSELGIRDGDRLALTRIDSQAPGSTS